MAATAVLPTITFGRRRGEAVERIVAGVILVGGVTVLLSRLAPLVRTLPTYSGPNALLVKLVLLPVLLAFAGFAIWLVCHVVRLVPRIIADHTLPLLTIAPDGITAYGVRATTHVAWSEVTAVRITSFRGAPSINLDRAIGDTVRLGLQPLDGPPDVVVDAITRYPAYRGT